MTGPTWSMDTLVAHAGRMRLLDRMVSADATGMITELTVREDDLFCVDGSVGGWVGIEYMAQSVAAWAGWRARQIGQEPVVGFLLGTRRYESHRPRFRVGETLRITVREQFQADNGLGQFACTIEVDAQQVASAALTVFKPADGAVPEGSGHG